MSLTIRFVGSLRAASSRSKITLQFEKDVSLREVVERVVKEQPKLKKALIDSELEDPRTNVLILVNGKDISVLNGLDTALNKGDEVVLIPFVHGG